MAGQPGPLPPARQRTGAGRCPPRRQVGAGAVGPDGAADGLAVDGDVPRPVPGRRGAGAQWLRCGGRRAAGPGRPAWAGQGRRSARRAGRRRHTGRGSACSWLAVCSRASGPPNRRYASMTHPAVCTRSAQPKANPLKSFYAPQRGPQLLEGERLVLSYRPGTVLQAAPQQANYPRRTSLQLQQFSRNDQETWRTATHEKHQPPRSRHRYFANRGEPTPSQLDWASCRRGSGTRTGLPSSNTPSSTGRWRCRRRGR